MPLPFIREFKLGGPKGDGVHPYLNEYGAFLGDETPLLEKDSLGRWQPRARPMLERSLSKSYRAQANLEWRMDSFGAVANALNKGNQSLAAIALVHAELPPLPGTAMANGIARRDIRLSKNGHDVSDELRVSAGQSGAGRWTDGGGGTALATATKDEWKLRDSVSQRAQDYQEQVTGLEFGFVVKLNGVRFDGCDTATRNMLEAVGRYDNFIDSSGNWRSWYTGLQDELDQMARQSLAAAKDGRLVEWHVAQEPVADFYRRYARTFSERHRPP